MNNKTLIVISFLVVALIIGSVLYFKNRLPQEASSSLISSAPASRQASTSPAVGNPLTVSLTPQGFSPQVITIKAGDTVSWINRSGGPATVNSNDHPTHLLYPALNLGGFDNGQSLSLTFPTPGTYGYHNHLNPSQTGTIVVE